MLSVSDNSSNQNQENVFSPEIEDLLFWADELDISSSDFLKAYDFALFPSQENSDKVYSLNTIFFSQKMRQLFDKGCPVNRVHVVLDIVRVLENPEKLIKEKLSVLNISQREEDLLFRIFRKGEEGTLTFYYGEIWKGSVKISEGIKDASQKDRLLSLMGLIDQIPKDIFFLFPQEKLTVFFEH